MDNEFWCKTIAWSLYWIMVGIFIWSIIHSNIKEKK
jgi:hypothetical protein